MADMEELFGSDADSEAERKDSDSGSDSDSDQENAASGSNASGSESDQMKEVIQDNQVIRNCLEMTVRTRELHIIVVVIITLKDQTIDQKLLSVPTTRTMTPQM